MKTFIELLNQILENDELIQIIFSQVRKKSLPFHKVSIRPVIIRGKFCYQLEYHYEKKVTHENIEREELLRLSEDLLSASFKQINIFSKSADYQILAAKPENPKIIKKPPTKKSSSLEHNQTKQYIIAEGKPCDFLIRLGVMQEDGQVIPKRYAKFRQINRFLEIVEDVLPHLKAALEKSPQQTLKIIDFGCGKAYLTFALYYYLKLQLQLNVEIIGLDLKEDVIEFCNTVAKDLAYQQLKFERGDIADYDDTASADMVVTLHACDTATDYALMKAVNWQASVILSVPCCQHELFRQIDNDINAAILKHGILKERFTAILTDGLRAIKLEEKGYHVDLIEFTSLEHTSKNIMIRAIKTKQKHPQAHDEFQRLLDYWHVQPTIAAL